MNQLDLNNRFLFINFALILFANCTYFLLYIGWSDYQIGIYLSFLAFIALIIFLINFCIGRQQRVGDGSGVSDDPVSLFLLIVVYAFFPFLTINMIGDSVNNEENQWRFFLALPAITTAVMLFYILLVSKNRNIIREILYIHGMMIMVIIPTYVLALSITGSFAYHALYPFGFIEKPKDAKWYLVANQGTKDEPRFLTSLSTQDLKNYKIMFEPFSSFYCNRTLLREYQKDYPIMANHTNNCNAIIKRENALYGYMAWNLGNERIFCPKSADFFAKNGSGNNKPADNSCLRVIGNQLQSISAGMLQ